MQNRPKENEDLISDISEQSSGSKSSRRMSASNRSRSGSGTSLCLGPLKLPIDGGAIVHGSIGLWEEGFTNSPISPTATSQVCSSRRLSSLDPFFADDEAVNEALSFEAALTWWNMWSSYYPQNLSSPEKTNTEAAKAWWNEWGPFILPGSGADEKELRLNRHLSLKSLHDGILAAQLNIKDSTGRNMFEGILQNAPNKPLFSLDLESDSDDGLAEEEARCNGQTLRELIALETSKLEEMNKQGGEYGIDASLTDTDKTDQTTDDLQENPELQKLFTEAELVAAHKAGEEAVLILRSVETQIKEGLAAAQLAQTKAELELYESRMSLLTAEMELLQAQQAEPSENNTNILFAKRTTMAVAKKKAHEDQQAKQKADFYLLLTSFQAIEQLKAAHEAQKNAHTLLTMAWMNAQILVGKDLQFTEAQFFKAGENIHKDDFLEALKIAAFELENSWKILRQKGQAKLWAAEKAKKDAKAQMLQCREQAAERICQAKAFQEKSDAQLQEAQREKEEAEIFQYGTDAEIYRNVQRANTNLLEAQEMKSRSAMFLQLCKEQALDLMASAQRVFEKARAELREAKQRECSRAQVEVWAAEMALCDAENLLSLSSMQGKRRLSVCKRAREQANAELRAQLEVALQEHSKDLAPETKEKLWKAKKDKHYAKFYHSIIKSEAKKQIEAMHFAYAKAEANLLMYQKAKADIEAETTEEDPTDLDFWTANLEMKAILNAGQKPDNFFTENFYETCKGFIWVK